MSPGRVKRHITNATIINLMTFMNGIYMILQKNVINQMICHIYCKWSPYRIFSRKFSTIFFSTTKITSENIVINHFLKHIIWWYTFIQFTKFTKLKTTEDFKEFFVICVASSILKILGDILLHPLPPLHQSPPDIYHTYSKSWANRD